MTDWQNLKLPWFERTADSPSVPDNFEGIVLTSPERVSLEQTRGRVPIFGAVRLKQETLDALAIADGHPLRAVVVGAIIGRSNQPFAGNAVVREPLFSSSAASETTEYFAVDLVECIGMPRSAGTVYVFASAGPFTLVPRKIEVTP